MIVNKDEFFREMTLNICSSLNLNTALSRAFNHLRVFFPLDRIALVIPDRNLSSIRLIACASVDEATPEVLLPLPEEIWKWLMEWKSPKILSASDPDNHVQAFAPYIKLHGHSDLAMPLLIEGAMIGFLILRALGEGKYTTEHLELLSTVAEPFAIALNNALALEMEVKLRDVLLDDNRFLNRELLSYTEDEIIGGKSGLLNVLEMVHQVAPLSNTVLLMGETGTGKELLANAIHFTSPRKDGPFIKVNCAAIPEGLIDSELFGHEKGAFTNAATEKRGRFERANGGTIFLDEIGELPLHSQVQLLRVLQTREIERVGGDKHISVDIRVIVATNRNLENMVSKNQFREDLWFRLNVFPIIVPPLRQRTEDIPALTRHFVEHKSRELGYSTPPAIAPGALSRLMNYGWPGNVRELENLVERELIRYKGGQLKFNTLLPTKSDDITQTTKIAKDSNPLSLDEAMALHIAMVLKLTKGKIHGSDGAAEILAINPSTLRARMNKLGIKYGRKTAPR